MTSCYLSAYIPAPHLAFWSGRPYYQAQDRAERDALLAANMACFRLDRQAARRKGLRAVLHWLALSGGTAALLLALAALVVSATGL